MGTPLVTGSTLWWRGTLWKGQPALSGLPPKGLGEEKGGEGWEGKRREKETKRRRDEAEREGKPQHLSPH